MADKKETVTSLLKDRQKREKDALAKKQAGELEQAARKDFEKKLSDKRTEQQKKDAEKRVKESSLKEYLEDGTDETVDAYEKVMRLSEEDIESLIFNIKE